jgi:integrase
LIHLTNAGKSANTINEAFYAIRWAHRLAGLAVPCKSDLVKTIREGSIRSVGRCVVKKEPITPEILRQLVNVYGFHNTYLKNIRVVCMCLLCYAGFLRLAELANLRRDHVFIYDNHVKLFLESSKTDVYREGRDALISKTNTPTCPVNMLLRYFYLAEIPADSTDYIFRPLCFCKSVNSHKLRSGKLSYTTAREILLSALEILGLNKKFFGLHSLRSGGATAAAAAKVEDILFF